MRERSEHSHKKRVSEADFIAGLKKFDSNAAGRESLDATLNRINDLLDEIGQYLDVLEREHRLGRNPVLMKDDIERYAQELPTAMHELEGLAGNPDDNPYIDAAAQEKARLLLESANNILGDLRRSFPEEFH